MTRILLVGQLAPPSPLVGARRIGGLAKYLSREALEVLVLTSRISGDGPIEGAQAVRRTADLMASPLNWRRGNLRAIEGAEGSSYAKPSRLQAVLVPDVAAATWLPFAVKDALALARRVALDCVVTTGPAHSAHLVGLALSGRGVAWIAEFRDGWTFDQPARTFPSRAQRRLDESLERRVARRADALVAVTGPIAADLSARFDRPARVLTNAFDPEEAPAAGPSLLDPERFSVVHTGRMAYSGRTPGPLLDGVRLLRRNRPDLVERLELVFAGPLSAEEEPLVHAPDLAGTVRAVGTIERARALRLQREADALLVLAHGSSSRSVATGKLFEYLAADAPILVLGEETEAARIVRETGSGLAASATDPEAIAAALADVVSRPRQSRDRAAIAQYAYPAVAKRYAELIAEAVARRGAQRSSGESA